MSIYTELAKKQELWEQMALNITKSDRDYKDIVQDMYFKIIKKGVEKDKLTEAYIYRVMNNIFLDSKRKLKSGEDYVVFVELKEFMRHEG